MFNSRHYGNSIRATDYIAALEGTRYLGSSASAAAHDGLNRWVGLFATAARRAVADAAEFDARAQARELIDAFIDPQRQLASPRPGASEHA